MIFKRRKKIEKPIASADDNKDEQRIPQGIFPEIIDNKVYFKERFSKSFDLILDEHAYGEIKIVFASLDGMYNNLLAVEGVIRPVCSYAQHAASPQELIDGILNRADAECDCKVLINIDDAVAAVLDGCMVLMAGGCMTALAFSVQGYAKRGIEEPQSEVQEFGSHEGFTELFKDNVTMIRRVLRTPRLVFETVDVGEAGNTKVCICYHADRAAPEIVETVRDRIKSAKLDVLFGSCELKPFLDADSPSLFSGVGMTERPDVLASKLSEGRVAVIVNGSPYALYVPHLFVENFHSLDDYYNRPYYAALIRILKIICFFIAAALPGIFVAVGTFHQELFPADVLYDIVASSSKTPFPLVIEALVIHFIYEIVREAGLRVPKVVGHAVSIVGALVIGDAAVTAGLIAAPMLIIVAMTAISSAAVPAIYQPVAVLRFFLIIVGGVLGLYGILMAFGFITANLCSVNPYGVPFMSPLSPFDKRAQRDNIFFLGWKKTGDTAMKIQNLKGSDLNE